MESKNNERLLHEISKLEIVITQLKFDYTIINDNDLTNIIGLLERKVKLEQAKIKAKDLKNKLAKD